MKHTPDEGLADVLNAVGGICDPAPTGLIWGRHDNASSFGPHDAAGSRSDQGKQLGQISARLEQAL
jgi:hypothetical protein